MLATISNLKALVTAAKKDAANRGIDETSLYVRAGVTKAQADALYTQLGGIDHTTLIRIMNVTRGAIAVVQFNGFDGGSAAGAPGNKDGDITITHNASMSSVLGDLAA